MLVIPIADSQKHEMDEVSSLRIPSFCYIYIGYFGLKPRCNKGFRPLTQPFRILWTQEPAFPVASETEINRWIQLRETGSDVTVIESVRQYSFAKIGLVNGYFLFVELQTTNNK